MELRTGILVLTSLCMLRTGASARFPGMFPGLYNSWMNPERQKESPGEAEVVYLPPLMSREAQSASGQSYDIPVPFIFDAFGRIFELQLVPNRRLLAPGFQVWSERGQEVPLSTVDASCHFLYAGRDTLAAFSACKDRHVLHGLIVAENSTYEVLPLSTGRQATPGHGLNLTPHEIRRAAPPLPPDDDLLLIRPKLKRRRKGKLYGNAPKNYTIELALFLDVDAYKTFYRLFNYKEAELRDMLLGYINGIQAIFQHQSLGKHIQLSLVRMTLLRDQPPELTTDSENNVLLSSFCSYQSSLNVKDDNDPQHWDLAVLASGSNFYSIENGKRNDLTLGLATVGGICYPTLDCVMAEFGVTDIRGKPFPSAGFSSIYIMAHEIGHSLGMGHDGTSNSCAPEGYIMSPSRGYGGEVTWSSCSAKVASELEWATCLFDGDEYIEKPHEFRDHPFDGVPGIVWTAKKQCELFLRDIDAAPLSSVPTAEICSTMTCRSPHRDGQYLAGPAISGTICGMNMHCLGGECVPTATSPPEPTTTTTTAASTEAWSPWREESCRSGCSLRSRGFLERRRTCQTASACPGAAYHVLLCDDRKVCGKKKRLKASELASRKCFEFAAVLDSLDSRGGGLQAPHDPDRLWMGCAIFCRSAVHGGFYAPRLELNDKGVNAYFPDGTWCHNDGTQDYYCQQRHCLPENFNRNADYYIWELQSEDTEGPFNARARYATDKKAVADDISAYLTINENGISYVRDGFPSRIADEPDENWAPYDTL